MIDNEKIAWQPNDVRLRKEISKLVKDGGNWIIQVRRLVPVEVFRSFRFPSYNIDSGRGGMMSEARLCGYIYAECD